jgi:hypothetical protein
MGINAQIRKTTFGAEDQSWLGSRTGTEDPDSITLDAAACIAITEFASGTVPSGIPLKRAGTGRYAPAITAEVADRWLLHTVDLTAGGTQAAANTPTAAMWRGQIIQAKIPAYTGRTSGVSAANVNIGLFQLV